MSLVLRQFLEYDSNNGIETNDHKRSPVFDDPLCHKTFEPFVAPQGVIELVHVLERLFDVVRVALNENILEAMAVHQSLGTFGILILVGI